MKLKKAILFLFITSVVLFAFESCGSTNIESHDVMAKGDEREVVPSKEVKEEPSVESKIAPKPVRLTDVPKYKFHGAELKIEVENMFYNDFLIFADPKASAGYAAKLINEKSYAVAQVLFPAGSYEALVNESAPDSEHNVFYVFIDGEEYCCYPSEPPLGTWELTTRVPMFFTFESERNVEIRIQQNGKKDVGKNGMGLDYIVITKK